MAGLITGIVAAVTATIGAGMSFANAAKQRRKASQASQDSKILMNQARARMQQNAYDNVNVPIEAYDRAFRENTAQQMQAIQSLQGADARTLAAGIGKVGAVGTASNESQRLALGKDLYENEKMKAKAQNEIRDELVSMDVGAARDQRQMQSDAQEARVASITSGLNALATTASTVTSALGPYKDTVSNKNAEKYLAKIDSKQIKGEQIFKDVANKDGTILKNQAVLDEGGNITYKKVTNKEQIEAVNNMPVDVGGKMVLYKNLSRKERNQFLKGLDPTKVDYSIF